MINGGSLRVNRNICQDKVDFYKFDIKYVSQVYFLYLPDNDNQIINN